VRSSNPLKIGMAVSLSGQFRVQGRQALSGLQAWTDDVNRAGGIRVSSKSPIPVSLVYYDDASSKSQVCRATERLITSDRVDILLGPYSSVLTQGAAEVAEKHEKLLWNQGGAADSIYHRGYRWIVGILTPASEYLTGLLPLLRQANLKASKVAIIRSASGQFPRAVCSGVQHVASELGCDVSLWDYLRPVTAFTELLDRVEALQPDILLGVGRIQDDLLLACELAGRRLELGAVVLVAAGIQQFHDVLGEESEGFLGPTQWEASSHHRHQYGPAAPQVLKSLLQHGSGTVDYPMVQAYAGALVAQRCIEAAETVVDADLRSMAGTLDFSTFYGRFRIDPETGRQTGHSALIVQWQQGRKVVVWPPEQMTGRLVYPWR
jgi:branched-chain amino acid transport system substrate-binding protein